MKKEIIVSGGAGFIGSNIVNELIKKNYIVYVFDNLSTGNINNLKNSNIHFINIDLKNDYTKWPNIDAFKFFHFAANADVKGGLINHNIDLNENLIVTKNVCDYCVSNNIKELIFASSATVYGEPSIFPTPETYFTNQTSLYGASKISCEAFIQAYSNYNYFKSTIFRFVSWLGIGYSHGVVYDFVKKLINNPHKLEILGNGKQVKSYLDVKDGIRGVFNLSELHNEKTSIFNLGHSEIMNVVSLANIICDEMNLNKVKYIYTGGERGWIGDSPLVQLDIEKAKNFGWQPSIEIEESIRSTVRYLLESEERRYR